MDQIEHIKLLIAIGEPTIKELLSDEFLRHPYFDYFTIEYAATIYGIRGEDGGRSLLTQTLRETTAADLRTKLVKLANSFEKMLPDFRENAVNTRLKEHRPGPNRILP